MTIPHRYRHQREGSNTALQAHMESTTRTVRVIEMRRQTIYSEYSSQHCPPSIDLALGTLTSVAALARTANKHTAEMVAIARTAGASWSQIGEALGITKQAAHKHFRTPPPPVRPVASVPATSNHNGAPARSQFSRQHAGRAHRTR